MNDKNPEIIYIESEDAGKRLDIFISEIFSAVSRNAIQKQIKSGGIKVNHEQVKPSYVLKIDDEISCKSENHSTIIIQPENIPVEVLYEDTMMAVVNKPFNMLTHPTAHEVTGTLVNALLHRFDSLSDCNGINRPGIVHRLDRNTSGLLMIAKTNEAYEFLKKELQEHKPEKKYYAVVSGNVDKDSETIRTLMGRHPSKPEKMAVTVEGKEAITHYRVIERLKGYTFLEVTIETGRTHQIRVHLSHIGHPIVNDSLYGGAKLPVKTSEQVLQAFSLTFVSPLDKVQRTIKIDYDDDIIKVLNYLRNTI